MNISSVCVIGLGYIGLPTAAVLASRKVRVYGVDINSRAVDSINQGKIHIVEPDLDILVHSVVNEGYLKASTTPQCADAFVIAVPTPFKNHFQPDLSYVEAAARSIAPFLAKGNLVVLESTSPVGTTEMISSLLAEMRPDLTFPHTEGVSADISIAYCPERVLPGHILRELVHNARVIGGVSPSCTERATELYKLFVDGECIATNSRTAEMCKLTENSFRDVNIAFANELSMICDKLDVNVWELIKLANRHPRVNILQPGPGVGGHCIAVDPWFIVAKTPEESRLIKTAREVNDFKPQFVIKKINELQKKFESEKGKAPSIAFLGLAFKANIDDLRESPALHIVEYFDGKLPDAVAVEPNIQEPPKSLKHIKLVGMEQGLNSDIIVLLVDHTEFKQLSKETLRTKFVLDTRGAWV
ncbi:UDP-N-acetyl-D-mannosamine dehydrogenase [Bdellovibrio bacteriovorus]|uniref:UDP-N-acetyl-D-mannosamine dehydrogenase n=1 Tax=Bdellovibrio bacteriovorus TaxID=959 RepID=UPI0035A73409